MPKDCLFDASVVLDLLNKRQRFDQVVEIVKSHSICYISTNSFLNLFYILRKENRNKQEIILETSFLELLDTTKQACIEALDLAQNLDDVEDCTELSLAKELGIEFFTADKDLKKKYTSFWPKIILVE